MPKIISLGEAVIDLFAGPPGVALEDADSFSPQPGGAPANVAVALARLGMDVGFISTVGDDPFGSLLVKRMQSEGIDTTHLHRIADTPTMIALVAASSPLDQDFIIYRGASTKLRTQDLDRGYISSAKAFTWGSVTMSAASRDAGLQAVRWANEAGVLVAFDANLRPALWPDLGAARQGILEGMKGAAVFKLNEVELELLAGTNDPAVGSRRMLDRGAKLCLVTLGSDGAWFNNGLTEGRVPAFNVEAVDTTGCGDAFLAALIAGLIETSAPPEELDEPTLRRLVRFANGTSAFAASQKGAMTSLPTRTAVDDFIAAGAN
jgi:fructokinase